MQSTILINDQNNDTLLTNSPTETPPEIYNRSGFVISLQWCHNGRDGVSNHQPRDYLLNRLLRRRSKKTSKLRVTGLCVGNSPVTGELPAQRASNAENVSIWWRHHVLLLFVDRTSGLPHWHGSSYTTAHYHWNNAGRRCMIYTSPNTPQRRMHISWDVVWRKYFTVPTVALCQAIVM